MDYTKERIVEDYAHDYRNMAMNQDQMKIMLKEFGEQYHDSYHNIECPQCGAVYNPAEDSECPYCEEEDEEDTHPQMGER